MGERMSRSLSPGLGSVRAGRVAHSWGARTGAAGGVGVGRRYEITHGLGVLAGTVRHHPTVAPAHRVRCGKGRDDRSDDRHEDDGAAGLSR